MNYEKTCYSLIGSLIAGAIIQDNMNLSRSFFWSISIGLWVICIGMQYYSIKREIVMKNKSDDQELAKRNEEFEKIISTLENCTNQQIATFKEELELINGQQIEDYKSVLEEIQKLTLSHERIFDMNSENNRDIIRMITEFDKKYIEHSKEQSSQMFMMLKENASSENELISGLQNRMQGCFSTLQSSLDSIGDNLIGINKTENRIHDCVNNMTEVISECMASSVQAIISDSHDNAKLIVQEVGKLDQEIEVIKVLNDCISKGITDILSLISDFKDDVIETETDYFKKVLDAEHKNNETLTKLIESARAKFLVLTECLDKNNLNSVKTIEQLSEELKGIISNLQGAVDFSNQYLDNIVQSEGKKFDIQEDAKNMLSEMRGEIQNCANQISERITESMDKQSEVISSEKEILFKYDEVLKRINDEVIVKMINDSNNMLKCMRDCYNLLDNIRRNKK